MKNFSKYKFYSFIVLICLSILSALSALSIIFTPCSDMGCIAGKGLIYLFLFPTFCIAPYILHKLIQISFHLYPPSRKVRIFIILLFIIPTLPSISIPSYRWLQHQFDRIRQAKLQIETKILSEEIKLTTQPISGFNPAKYTYYYTLQIENKNNNKFPSMPVKLWLDVNPQSSWVPENNRIFFYQERKNIDIPPGISIISGEIPIRILPESIPSSQPQIFLSLIMDKEPYKRNQDDKFAITKVYRNFSNIKVNEWIKIINDQITLERLRLVDRNSLEFESKVGNLYLLENILVTGTPECPPPYQDSFCAVNQYNNYLLAINTGSGKTELFALANDIDNYLLAISTSLIPTRIGQKTQTDVKSVDLKDPSGKIFHQAKSISFDGRWPDFYGSGIITDDFYFGGTIGFLLPKSQFSNPEKSATFYLTYSTVNNLISDPVMINIRLI